ncbi:hypothetical protein B0H16DRAFT_1745237 [Mycena metata]|uniref:Uncharacterized protein n=1 Tax=Mycena metata TaxID=1033252 RepID=A0AAD7H402_9AGAR|nr:hypothetical protein B0H16DRAFT_1745237 [Mycena metata]
MTSAYPDGPPWFAWASVDGKSARNCIPSAKEKLDKGLCTTGVGGTCVRHNMGPPNGIGDLQFGERCCDMDSILSSALPNAIFVESEDVSAQGMRSGQNTDPPSPSDVADPAPGHIFPGPAIVGLSKALEGLRAMQERDHRQRILNATRAQAEAAALQQEHEAQARAALQQEHEAQARAAAAHRRYLSRQCPSSQEYQDRVERSRQRRVVAKDAEAAAWHHAFQVSRRQGVGVSGAPSSFIRLQRRFAQRRAERRVVWSAEEAAIKHARNIARFQGVGTSTTPDAVLRKKKYRLFSPAPDSNDCPSGDEQG